MTEEEKPDLTQIRYPSEEVSFKLEGDIGNENLVLVDKDKVMNLMALNAEYRADIITLVSILNGLQGLFAGKGITSLMPAIMQLVKNPQKMEALSAMIPIIQKYTENNGEAKQIEQ
jgi:hypothetical protein